MFGGFQMHVFRGYFESKTNLNNLYSGVFFLHDRLFSDFKPSNQTYMYHAI